MYQPDSEPLSLNFVKPVEHWPSGDSKPIAILKFSPEELSQKYHMEFEEDFDGLDYFKLAALDAAEIGQIWFMRYKNEPDSGTTLLIDSKADMRAALAFVRKHLMLSQDDFSWFPTSEK